MLHVLILKCPINPDSGSLKVILPIISGSVFFNNEPFKGDGFSLLVANEWRWCKACPPKRYIMSLTVLPREDAEALQTTYIFSLTHAAAIHTVSLEVLA